MSATVLPPGPPSLVVASVGRPLAFVNVPAGLNSGVGFPPSCQSDPDGVDIHASLASSLWVHPSNYGGFSSRLLHQDSTYDPVSPLHQGGGSTFLATGYNGGLPGHYNGRLPDHYGGLPQHLPGCLSVGVFEEHYSYGGFCMLWVVSLKLGIH